MVNEIFVEIAVILILAIGISTIMRIFKQPMIIGYIITGILAGPYLLNVVHSEDIVTTFSKIGIAFLLFIAGLSLNPSRMKDVGKVAIITGLAQILFTSVVGFIIAKGLGFTDIVSIYVAIALTFSSTIIIVKLISDKGDLESLYGRISLGFLLVQDIVAIVILMIVSSTVGGLSSGAVSIETIVLGLFALCALGLFTIQFLPRFAHAIAKSQEFLFLFSISWLFLFAVTFHLIGFSIEIGALIAGISLSTFPYNYEIRLKTSVLRDFFILFFFILLGAQMVFGDLTLYWFPIVIFSLFVLIGNPIIVMVIMGALRYTKRNSFFAGLSVAQISEFSLILILLGVSVGHLTDDVLSMVTAIALITIFGSTYMISHSNKFYQRISKYLGVFERSGVKKDAHEKIGRKRYDIILFGYDKTGFSLLESFKNIKKSFLVVDYNPEVLDKLKKNGYDAKYGDANDLEVLNTIDFKSARMVVSTIPKAETNMMLIEKVKSENKNAIIIAVAHENRETMELYKKGASYVIMPYYLGSEYASMLIERHKLDLNKFLVDKAKHIDDLKLRLKLKHYYRKVELKS
ncbi:MAG: cation:proton antiporter [Nanoarchaeota archaeon]|nr:cation:proton antiporter [Nanoarchaeota archaeon]